jgi:Nucleotide-diphospho-sugar transferase
VDLARSLIEDYGFQEVVWSDTDVVWLRDPRPFFAAHPAADVAIQTDCLSHAVEAGFTAPLTHGFARCGHLPGNAHNNALNTGMILLRDRPPTRAFLRAWLDYLLDANKMYVNIGGGQAVVGDQLAMNTLMTQGSQPWRSVDAAGDWRVVWAHSRTVKACAGSRSCRCRRMSPCLAGCESCALAGGLARLPAPRLPPLAWSSAVYIWCKCWHETVNASRLPRS